MTDYIVAIDLGTSHVTGIVGEKNADGAFSIIACGTEDSSSCIHRGNIYNVDDTAEHVTNLIRKLERSLKGGYIDKIYAGIGGQSLRTIDHVEVKDIENGEVVTKDDIRMLKEQCGKYKIDLKDVLDIAPAVYYVDGNKDANPVGVSCKRLEARYKIVIGRESIRRELVKSIKDRCKKEIAGIIVSPLALADAMLSKEEKELGCALVDFGAGVTSVTIYKNGDLLHSIVIPLGANLITRDIGTLQLTEAESEKLKIEYGCAILQKEEDDKVTVDMESSDREISINDLNAIVEARAKEIVENVYARIKEVIDVKTLSSGIVLAGRASELDRLPELIKETCKIKARHSAIRGALVRGSDDMIGNPLYMTAVSLMLKGTEQCVSLPVVQVQENKEEEEGSDNINNGNEDGENTTERGGFFSRRGNKKKNKSRPKEEEIKSEEAIVKGEEGGGKAKTGWGSIFGDIFTEN
jgi:cell division protein FtsA